MKGVLVFFIIIKLVTTTLLSKNDIRILFKKLLKNELSGNDNTTLSDLFQVVFRSEPFSTESFRSNPALTKLDCMLCRASVTAIFEAIRAEVPTDSLVEQLTFMCTNLGVGVEKVCRGYIGLNLPVVSHIVRTVPEATPATFCALGLQNAKKNDDCILDDPRFDWKVDLPERTDYYKFGKSRAHPKSLRVAIITDPHLDPMYEPYGTANCGEPVCCRYGQHPVSSGFWVRADEDVADSIVTSSDGEVLIDISDAARFRQRRSDARKYGSTRITEPPAGYWGDYRACDTPVWAFNDIVDSISEKHKNIDIVYYIGDAVHHGVWTTDTQMVERTNEYVVYKLHQNFGDVPIMPAVGNHDVHPSDLFANYAVTGAKLNTTWLYNILAQKWRRYLTDDARRSFRKRGGYSQLIRPGLRVVSLNNNVAFKNNWWLVYDPLDAKQHMEYLVEELAKAEAAGEKVHILTHIPAGSDDLFHTWTREYNRVVNRFSSTITAEFNGHKHADDFRIFYNRNGKPINVAWGGGSATAYSNFNLNYKIVTIDGRTKAPSNIKSYSYNLTHANLMSDQRPHWEQLYDMKKTFRLKNLSAASMDKLVKHMVTDKVDLFDKYSEIYSKRSDVRTRSCDEECKLSNLCNNVVTVLWDESKCEELKQLFSENYSIE